MKMQKGNITVDTNELTRMCQGNPGAAEALVQLVLINHSLIHHLNEWGILGSDIYVFWSDICNRNTIKMAGVIKATADGRFDKSVLRDACSRQDYSGKDMVPVSELIIDAE